MYRNKRNNIKKCRIKRNVYNLRKSDSILSRCSGCSWRSTIPFIISESYRSRSQEMKFRICGERIYRNYYFRIHIKCQDTILRHEMEERMNDEKELRMVYNLYIILNEQILKSYFSVQCHYHIITSSFRKIIHLFTSLHTWQCNFFAIQDVHRHYLLIF